MDVKSNERKTKIKVVALSSHWRCGKYWFGQSAAEVTSDELNALKADKRLTIVEDNPPSVDEVLSKMKRAQAEKDALEAAALAKASK